ncbi:hypothetical protein [Algoriphagus sp. AK58]|uniref:hypothetical protein n=1 Tax=Algoriphagus sp. AK58 TaxID=1406877 RepID=UPI00164FA5F3|nr:hypothetical protein [Algoriphagus sp. AK58]
MKVLQFGNVLLLTFLFLMKSHLSFSQNEWTKNIFAENGARIIDDQNKIAKLKMLLETEIPLWRIVSIIDTVNATSKWIKSLPVR